jgi:hypothetical protein
VSMTTTSVTFLISKVFFILFGCVSVQLKPSSRLELSQFWPFSDSLLDAAPTHLKHTQLISLYLDRIHVHH